MAIKQYRVVATSWGPAGRVEKDIGCAWKPEAAAKAELKQFKLKHQQQLYSLQKKDK